MILIIIVSLVTNTAFYIFLMPLIAAILTFSSFPPFWQLFNTPLFNVPASLLYASLWFLVIAALVNRIFPQVTKSLFGSTLVVLITSFIITGFYGRLHNGTWNKTTHNGAFIQEGAGTSRFLFINRGLPLPFRGVSISTVSFPYTSFTVPAIFPPRYTHTPEGLSIENITHIPLFLVNWGLTATTFALLTIYVKNRNVLILFHKPKKITVSNIDH